MRSTLVRTCAVILSFFCSFISDAQTTPCDWVDVSGGENHTLALRRDGTIWAWGLNFDGQLGQGNTTTSLRPLQVGTASNWVKISAGDLYCTAINATGELWAWGSNYQGELGIGSLIGQTLPVRVGTASDWQTVHAGYGHTVATKTTGTLWTWGWNSSGQLGLNDLTRRTSPVQVGTGTNWAQGSAGVEFTLARQTNGTVWSTGLNAVGQLGQNNTTNRTTFAQIAGLANVTHISAGAQHALAISTVTGLRSWGFNGSGQLGDGTFTTRLAPVAVAAAGFVLKAEAHNSYSNYMNTGILRSWGLNSSGQLGDGTTVNRNTPVTINLVNDPYSIMHGSNSLGFNQFISTNGEYLRPTGSNANGKFGNSTTTNSLVPLAKHAVAGPAGVCQGTQFWYDASNPNNTIPATTVANNTAVSAWRDVSHNLNDATVLAGQGTPAINSAQINGKDVMHFTRSSQTAGTVYNVANVDIRAGGMPKTTSFTVYRQGPKAAGEWHGIWGNDNGNWDRFFMPSFGTNDGIVSVGAPANAVTVTNAGLTGQTRLLTAVYDKGVLNGSTIYFNALPVQTVTDNTDNVDAQTTVRIGFDGDDNCYNGDIAEMIWYNRLLTQCEILSINKYLGYKYGVTFTTASITPSSSIICSGGSVTLTSSNATSWQWMLNGSNIGGATAQTYNATAGGSYQVITDYGGCKDTSLPAIVREVFPRLYVDSSVVASGTGQSWASPLKTVSEALYLANNSTCTVEIWAKKGTYYPADGLTGVTATSRDSSLRILRNNIKLYGGFAGTEAALTDRVSGNTTYLSGNINLPNDSTDNSYHVITVFGPADIDANTVIDGVTITEGVANVGTGLTVYGHTYNRQDGAGAYIGINAAGRITSPTVSNCVFTKNTAIWGGAIYLASFNGAITSPAFYGSSFTDNRAVNDAGAIFSNTSGTGGSSPLFDSCLFERNRGNTGGALRIVGGPGTVAPVFRNTAFISNVSVTFHGGAIYTGGVATVSVQQCLFALNSNNLAGISGGAIFMDGSGGDQTLNVDQCSFIGNSTFNNGGAIRTNNFGAAFNNTNVIRNSLFWGNTAAGITDVSPVQPALTTVTNCVLQQYGTHGQNGNSVGRNPQIINATNPYGADGILRTADDGANLTQCSRPAINRGDNSFIPAGITNDFRGVARIQQGIVDIGAYESPYIPYDVTITVTPSLATQQCNNPAVFTATPANTGANPPSYQWYINNVPVVGATNAVFTAPALANGDSVYVLMTPNFPGCTAEADTSNQIKAIGGVVPNVMYVDGSVATTGSGASWASPFKTLTQALKVANFTTCATEIWVKAGTYLPMRDLTTVATSRDSSFRILRDNIKVYGGFAGTETAITQRNIATSPTILSGDINVAGNNADNSHHVVTIIGSPATPVSSATVLDGFIIQDGRNNGGGSLTVNGQTFARQDGGGIYVWGSNAGNNASPAIANCTITRNSGTFGSGVYLASFNSGTNNTTFTDCRFYRDTATNAGGGLLSNGVNTNTLFTNCVFEENIATNTGGGIWGSNSGGPVKVTAVNCIFRNNRAANGGAFLIGNPVPSTGFATFTGCLFEGNTATASGAAVYSNNTPITVTSSRLVKNSSAVNGGGVYMNGSTLTMSADTVHENRAVNYGGGIYLVAGAAATVTDCSLYRDTANFGAGVFISGLASSLSATRTLFHELYNGPGNCGGAAIYNQGTVSARDCIFSKNISINTGGTVGGGIYLGQSGSGAIINSVFADNVAGGTNDDGGGAILMYGGTLTVSDVTFSNNTTTSTVHPTGNTISTMAGSTTTINNSIIWGGAADHVYAGGTVNFNYSNVKGLPAAGTNISTDPFFIDAANAIGGDNIWRTADDGLHLVNCSKSINTGSNALIPAGTPLDIAGDTRIQQSIVDMGAYEQPYVAPPAQSVTIAITSGAQTICSGESVTFTATPVNGGPTPTYQWQINGVNAGTNSPTFTTTTLADNDVVTVILTSSLQCIQPEPSIVSNGITITVVSFLTPSVSIAITSGAQTICDGTSVTFTATPTNGGTAPIYQWQVNGVNAGTNSPTFTSTTLANNDVVHVILTSSFACVTTNNVVSNDITMTVNPNLTPSISIAITSGAQTICDGTSVTFTATPTNGGTTPVYQWQVNGVNAGTNSPTFTSTTLANNDVVTVILTSNVPCPATNNVTSNAITMMVNPNLTPSVSIAITSGTQTMCAGTSVTFTATPTNGGTAPAYQWQVNGVNTGTNSPTFTSTTLADNDVVTVILTSNVPCPVTNNVTSNGITMAVNPNLTPSVSIAITSGAQTICDGTSVTFTATPTNGGAAPVYQWQVNGVNAGTNAPTFTSTTLANNDVVTVILTSNVPCPTTNNVTSNAITMTVNPNLTPSVSIAITSGSQTICAGTSVTFTATPTNGGTAPVYQWQVNGVNAGTNSPTFTSTTLANNDVVTVILTSNVPCPVTNNVTSNAITMKVNPNLTPSVSIAITSGAQTICAGTSVTFTATPTNGGTAPAYQWQVNGSNAGTNSPTFTSTTLANNDVVTVILRSNVPCPTVNNVASNSITMTVNPNLTPSVSIAITSGAQTICAGTSVTFTATPTNGGSNPAYQWKVNGLNAGANSPTFTTSSLQNNDVVTVVMTSNETCLASNNPTSNSVTMTVNANLTPQVSITAPKTVVCGNESLTFTATPVNGGTAPVYQWRKNGLAVGGNSPQYTSSFFNNNDVIQLQMTTSVGCFTAPSAVSNAIIVTVAPDPIVTLNPPKEVPLGGTVQLTAASSQPVLTYSWTPAASLNDPTAPNPMASPLTTTTYRLDIVSVFGCKGSGTTVVKVIAMPQIANTFTPNNDGIHDFWEIKHLEAYPNSRVQVFTRTGQKVFETKGYARPWDGNMNGKALPSDTYYYIIEWNNTVGSKPLTGYVTIIK